MPDSDDPNAGLDIIQQAKAFLDLCEEATSENRTLAMEDVRFRDGDQWPPELIASRRIEKRPRLTINKTDAYCTAVENQQRQQRPRIKVDPTGSDATVKVAQVVQGLIRHIENNRGGGDLAYDTSFSQGITGGEGYIRVMADYASEDTFEQELYLAPIENQFTVYLDPHSQWPDGSDAEQCLITTMLSRAEFKRQYPKADPGSNFTSMGVGDSQAMWITKSEVRVAEFWRLERVPRTLVRLSTGEVLFKDELPKVLPPTIAIVEERKSWRKQLHYWKLTGLEVLEDKLLPGKWLPIIPVYGKSMIVAGRRRRKGLVRNARDPATMYNYARTAQVEAFALGAKAKWKMAAGQDEGFENEWRDANVSALPVLHYNQIDVDGKDAPPPEYIQPEGPSQGAIALAASVGEDLSAVLGIVDPAMRVGGNVSGKALNAERQQSDVSTFNFYDNLTRSIAQVGRVLLDLIPFYYGEPGRVVRIIGDDGNAKTTTLNEQNESPGEDTPGPVEAVINDVTNVGQYMIVMDTGPGFATKRQEAVTAMMPLIAQNEDLMKVAGDLVFRQMDFPGAEVIADRLAAANPLAQIDDMSEVPPQVQMKLKQDEQTIQQLQQALQAAEQELKVRSGIEQMKQDGETKRELMRQTTRAHDMVLRDQTAERDTAVKAHVQAQDSMLDSQTALTIEQIKAHLALLLAHIDGNNAREAAEQANEEATERAI